MKWIKSRASFLNEDKIGDKLLDPQKKEIESVWGKKFLDFEEVEATDRIKQGNWKLSKEDKMKALSIFLSSDLEKVYEFFGSLPDNFVEVVKESLDLSLLTDNKYSKILNNFDLKEPTINQIAVLSHNIFKKISMGESKADEIIERDANGRPVMGEDGRPLKRKREEGEIIFSKNLTNINGVCEDYNNLFPSDKVDAFKFSSGEVQKVINGAGSDFGGDSYVVEVDIFVRDLFLRIDHNPKDILNMSVSRFFGSCQHLYRGAYRTQLIGNIFDPNSIPAFLVFDSPIINSEGVMLSEQTPLSRMMIRNIHSFDPTEESKIYFDRAYPDKMKDFFDEMVEKYTPNKKTADSDSEYVFAPDLPEGVDVRTPYMDRLGVVQKRYIGVNSSTLTFSPSDDWSSFIISPKAKVEEINIETPLIPDNFFQLNLSPKWIRLRYIDIRDLNVFSKIKSESWAFEKCKMKSQVFNQFAETHTETKSLQFVNCDITGFDLSTFTKLESLDLVFMYNFEPSDLEKLLVSINPIFQKLPISTEFKQLANQKRGFKLTITSDLVEKEYINSLKNKGVIVKVYEDEVKRKRDEQRKK